MTTIGDQDGIKAYFDWFRKQPNVPQRGPGYSADDIATWPWPDKMQRTMQILADDHDAGGQSLQQLPFAAGAVTSPGGPAGT